MLTRTCRLTGHCSGLLAAGGSGAGPGAGGRLPRRQQERPRLGGRRGLLLPANAGVPKAHVLCLDLTANEDISVPRTRPTSPGHCEPCSRNKGQGQGAADDLRGATSRRPRRAHPGRGAELAQGSTGNCPTSTRNGYALDARGKKSSCVADPIPEKAQGTWPRSVGLPGREQDDTAHWKRGATS